MLTHLTIRNVAIIEQVDIDFHEGLNILSGETGAGKSIIIDSMNLVLGERADRDLIRAGSESAKVEAQFIIEEDSPVRDMLRELGTEDDIVILSRELSMNGRNVCRINGSLSTVSQLREISERLVDIHGQHEHQSLMNDAQHIDILDGFGTEESRDLLTHTDSLYESYHEKVQRLNKMRADEKTRLQRIDMLDFQIQEIEQIQLADGEEEELKGRLRIASNMEKITTALSRSYEILYSGDENSSSAADMLSSAEDNMSEVRDISEEFGNLCTRINALTIEINDIADEVRGMLHRFEYDPDELNAIQERLDAIRVVERKYGLTIGDVLSYLDDIRRQREMLLSGEKTQTELEKQIKEDRAAWVKAASSLTDQRRKKAREIERKIEGQLADLGMGGAKFSIVIDTKTDETPRRGGADTVVFLIATNPGEPLKPLSKTASGGELSRIMLALKNVLADSDHIPTMIFDEIDTGVSGHMARVIAEKLHYIAALRQIICVTHTAQIAAMADVHFKIEKTQRQQRNITTVEPLDEDARIKEISRLVGGTEVSSKSLDHAREMVKWSRRFKTKS